MALLVVKVGVVDPIADAGEADHVEQLTFGTMSWRNA